MSRRARSLLILLSFPFGYLLGCDDVTGPAPDEAGTFSATVSGSVTRAFSGGAVFSPDAPGVEYGFAIALVDSIDSGAETFVRHAVYLYREAGGVPPVGEHAVGAQAPFRVGAVLGGDGDDPLLCVAESGAVQITTADAAAVRGTFEVQALCFHVGDELASETVLASGSFSAVGGAIAVPGDVTELPILDGRFELLTAKGNPLPASVFNGMVLIGDDLFVHLEIFVTDGYLEFGGSGSYEHRVSQAVYVDGQPAPSLDWVDRGRCVASFPEFNCVSALVANRSFTALLANGALEVTQDLNGEGLAVTYRYARGW